MNSQGFETESEKSNMTESVSQRGRESRDKFEDENQFISHISNYIIIICPHAEINLNSIHFLSSG